MSKLDTNALMVASTKENYVMRFNVRNFTLESYVGRPMAPGNATTVTGNRDQVLLTYPTGVARRNSRKMYIALGYEAQILVLNTVPDTIERLVYLDSAPSRLSYDTSSKALYVTTHSGMLSIDNEEKISHIIGLDGSRTMPWIEVGSLNDLIAIDDILVIADRTQQR